MAAARKPTKGEQLWSPSNPDFPKGGLSVVMGRRFDRLLKSADSPTVSEGVGFYHPDTGWGHAARVLGERIGGTAEHGAAVLSAWSNGVGHMRNVTAGIQAVLPEGHGGGLRHGRESVKALGGLYNNDANREAVWKEHVVPGSAIDSLKESRAGIRGTLKGFHLLAQGGKNPDPMSALGGLKQREFAEAIVSRRGVAFDKHMAAIGLGNHDLGYDETSDALRLDEPYSYGQAKSVVQGVHRRMQSELADSASKRIPQGHPLRQAHEAGHELRESDTQSVLWFAGRAERPDPRREKAEQSKFDRIVSRFPDAHPKNLGLQFRI